MMSHREKAVRDVFDSHMETMLNAVEQALGVRFEGFPEGSPYALVGRPVNDFVRTQPVNQGPLQQLYKDPVYHHLIDLLINHASNPADMRKKLGL